MKCKHKKYLWIASISLLLAFPVVAQELSLDPSGRSSLFGKWGEHSATDLVPDSSESGYAEAIGGVSSVVNLKLDYDRLSAVTRVRADVESDKQIETLVDEAYAELLTGESSFVYAGRRILSYGHAYGLNPADIFRDPLAEKSIFPSSQARHDVQGANLVGSDTLFTNGGNVSVIYVLEHPDTASGAQKNFGILRYSGFTSDGSLDYAASLFGGNRPGISSSFGQGIGDASVLYIDATLRKGREKQIISEMSQFGNLAVAESQESHMFPFITAGFGNSLESGLSVNVELTHDDSGYSGREWKSVIEALDTITPVQSQTHARSLGQLNGLLNHHTLRRNYGFLRLSDTYFSNFVESELTVLHGLDDGSGNIGLRLEVPLKGMLLAGMYATQKYGENNTEFRLRPEKSVLTIYATAEF